MEQKEVWEKVARPWQSFRENQKLIEDVSEFLKGKAGKILDLGCGSGRYFAKIRGKIYAMDFSKKMLELAKGHAKEKGIDAEFFQAEAYALPFKDDFFDSAIFIAALHCIESAEKRKKSLEELFRVLKKEGKAIITAWSRNSERVKNKPKEAFIPWTVDGKKYFRYYYIYEKNELEALLKEVGFKILSIKEGKNIIAIVEKG